jgi:predicted membrane channel-forming protein YqfA (hemolysin III family)
MIERRNLGRTSLFNSIQWLEASMDGIIYLVGLIVIIMFILSFFGLR